MKRTKPSAATNKKRSTKNIKEVDFIICSDLHFRDTVPQCRVDNYFGAQAEKILKIQKLQEEWACPVLCAGDVLDKWRISPEFEAWALKQFPSMVVVPGQHDLPQHSMKLLHKSSLSVLMQGFKVFVLEEGRCVQYEMRNSSVEVYVYGFPWGSDIEKTMSSLTLETGSDVRNIAILHRLTVNPSSKDSHILMDAGGTDAPLLFKKLPGFDLIITGDNHQTFSIEKGNQLLINPGSMMRMTGAQYEHAPGVFLVHVLEEGGFESMFVPFDIDKEAVSRDHLIKKEERDGRIDAFISKIQGEHEMGLSFEKNIEEILRKNKIRNGVQDVVWEAVESGGVCDG